MVFLHSLPLDRCGELFPRDRASRCALSYRCRGLKEAQHAELVPTLIATAGALCRRRALFITILVSSKISSLISSSSCEIFEGHGALLRRFLSDSAAAVTNS
jgi:hypothetical protein